MLLDRYQETIDELYKKIKGTQREAIIDSGKMIADAIKNGGCIHIFDTGHIINSELIFRGGGMLCYKEFKYALTVSNPVRTRDRSSIDTSVEGLAMYALKASGAMPGDVLILGSVSGKTTNVIDLALAAKEFGLKTIAVTSLEYSSKVPSDHSSGKRLFECTDIVLDNCAPAAEAMLEVPGLPARFAAASGLSAAFIMWSVTAVAVETLLENGITPSVLKSHNFEGGPEFNEELKKIYSETGF